VSQATPAIEVHGLIKQFGAKTAVDAFDLVVDQGELCGLIGPDGAGKTTFMRLLAGILAIDGGEAKVAGCDVRREPEAVKRRIGYLSQVFSLYTDLTIDENLDFVADLYSTPRGEVAALKEELLALTGLAEFRTRQAGRLSGGMKQKLGLSCALIHRPEVLLLDEPTTGVDPVARREFWRILWQLPGQGVTVLLTSPYMDEASRCGRVAMMDRGRKLADGTVHQLQQDVPGTMLQIVCARTHDAAQAVARLAGVRSVTPFGDALHVRLEPPADEQRVTAALREAGVDWESIEPIEPTLEDAFLALVGEVG